MENNYRTVAKILTQIVVGLILLVIATAVGIYVERYNTQDNERIRYLEYSINNSNLLSAPTIQGKNLKVLLDKKTIKNLHQLEIKFFNFSDIDYENIPVYLTFLPENDEKFNIVAVDAVGSESIPETVEPITILSFNNINSHRYGYKIKTANRGKYGESYILLVTFLITGIVPKVDISIDKKGVKSRRFSYYNYSSSQEIFPKWLSEMFLIIVVFTFYAIMIFIALKFQKKNKKKQQEKYRKWLIEKTSNKEDADRLIKISQEYNWVSYEPKILRSLFGPEKPNNLEEKG